MTAPKVRHTLHDNLFQNIPVSKVRHTLHDNLFQNIPVSKVRHTLHDNLFQNIPVSKVRHTLHDNLFQNIPVSKVRHTLHDNLFQNIPVSKVRHTLHDNLFQVGHRANLKQVTTVCCIECAYAGRDFLSQVACMAIKKINHTQLLLYSVRRHTTVGAEWDDCPTMPPIRAHNDCDVELLSKDGTNQKIMIVMSNFRDIVHAL